MSPLPPPYGRRRFLGQCALLAAGGALADAAGQSPTPIIDTHVHFYDPTRPGVEWPPRDIPILYSPHLPRQWAAIPAAAPITGVVVIEAEARPDDNRWVLELARSNPIIVGYIARLLPGQADFQAHLERYRENSIFRGLRLKAADLAQGLDQPAFQKDLHRLAEGGFTLDLVGGPALAPYLGRLAQLAPDLRMVIDHLPFPEWDRDPKPLRAAASLPHVFAKISNIARRTDGKLVTDPDYYRPSLDALWELFGDDRVLYGSNWPVSDLVAPYADVLKIAQDYVQTRGDAAAEKFFCKNSRRAYEWQ